MGRLSQGATALSLPPGLKVALFSGNYNYLKEGANQALNLLVRHLEQRSGAIVRVYSPVTSTPAFEPAGTLVPVPSVTLPFRSEFQLALGLPRSIRADLAAFAPDIVHLSTPDILDTRALTYAKRQGLPVVTSLHTSFETYLDYYGLGFIRPLVEWHLNRFYGRSDFVLVPTEALAAPMRRRIGSDRVRIWARGVDAGLFNPGKRSHEWRTARGIADQTVAMLFFGRLVREKGIDIFAAALQALIERGTPVVPVLVGVGPERDRIARMLPSAIFTGHLTGEALATAIASCDILLHPSVTETFGNVVLEAMASGLAVVAALHPSAANLIEHGRSGLLVDPDSPAGFVEAPLQLISDTARRGDLAREARATALHWRWDEILDGVLDVYAEALAHRPV